MFFVILALFAPRARKHTESFSYFELFEVPWESKLWFSLIFIPFSEQQTFYSRSYICNILAIFTKKSPLPPDPGPARARKRQFGAAIRGANRCWAPEDPNSSNTLPRADLHMCPDFRKNFEFKSLPRSRTRMQVGALVGNW